ncbi:MAG: AbrB/MazE/SpoVT family DNA-binding domain-containing protein [candidate division KSB1 bacterium]|nr:AbrB/MazE/SpoVT family DNA-binding domain-containing protein [candidate division KSB1 bacterium]MDQ7063528.1 AbrB/MazE/SpoVT family DNA-binding domain-containing protein [candidate division KSB1 bacterium]
MTTMQEFTMSSQISKIDKQGRILILARVRKKYGLKPDTEVYIEIQEDGIFIRHKPSATPISHKIGQMNLPVSEWDKMEDEIKKGIVSKCRSAF